MVTLSEQDFEQIKSLQNGLKPLEELIKYLCCENMDLYTSEKLQEVTLRVLKCLKKQNTGFSKKLHQALKNRYLERRNHRDKPGEKVKDVISFITFLRDPTEFENYSSDSEFPLSSEAELKKLGKKLIVRMFFGDVQS